MTRCGHQLNDEKQTGMTVSTRDTQQSAPSLTESVADGFFEPVHNIQSATRIPAPMADCCGVAGELPFSEGCAREVCPEDSSGQPIGFRVVNLRTEKAFIRVCRPSRWGNPWRIQRIGSGDPDPKNLSKGLGGYKIWRFEKLSGIRRLEWHSDHIFTQQEAHAFAVRIYRSWILEHPELVTALMLEIHERGARDGWTSRDHPDEVTLGCWCTPLPCHAEVLAELLLLRSD